MRTYLDYHVINFLDGYNVSVDKDGAYNVPCGWIMADQLGMYLQTYLDMKDNKVYIRFPKMDDFIEVPQNRGV